MSQGTNMNESCHIYAWDLSYLRISHGTHICMSHATHQRDRSHLRTPNCIQTSPTLSLHVSNPLIAGDGRLCLSVATYCSVLQWVHTASHSNTLQNILATSTCSSLFNHIPIICIHARCMHAIHVYLYCIQYIYHLSHRRDRSKHWASWASWRIHQSPPLCNARMHATHTHTHTHTYIHTHKTYEQDTIIVLQYTCITNAIVVYV